MRLPIQVQARNARCKARPGSRLGLISSSCSNDCQTPRSVTTSARRSSRLGWPSRQRFAEARQLRIPAVLAGSVSGRIIDFQNGRARGEAPSECSQADLAARLETVCQLGQRDWNA